MVQRIRLKLETLSNISSFMCFEMTYNEMLKSSTISLLDMGAILIFYMGPPP